MAAQPVFVGIGGNLPSRRFGTPRAVLEAAVAALSAACIDVQRRSRWYATAPVPASDQPDFVNGVLEIGSALNPVALLQTLHGIERAFGRERSVRDAARVLDLDLLAYGDRVCEPTAHGPTLPHPRLHLRAFVLRPLVDLAPNWRHPVLGQTAAELLAALADDQRASPLPEETVREASKAGG